MKHYPFRNRCHLLALLPLMFFLVGPISAKMGRIESYRKEAKQIGDQRFDKKLWNKSMNTSLGNKSFPITDWDKHFSSLGKQRSSLSTGNRKDKKIVDKKMWNSEVVNFDMSEWNEKMSALRKDAGIQVDDSTPLVSDSEIFSAMLKDSQHFTDAAGKEVSLRDLNRYQFRRNHSEAAVPVESAGSE